MNSSVRLNRAIFWLLAFVGLAADLGSKYAIWTQYRPGEEGLVVIPSVLSLIRQPGLNHGALFGIFNDHGETSNLFFAVVSGAAVAGIILWTLNRQTASDRLFCAALGLVLAGAMGNLFDRVVYGGVRDFIWFRYGSFNWPVFNVADSCLVCGAGLMLVHAFCGKHAPETATTTQRKEESRQGVAPS